MPPENKLTATICKSLDGRITTWSREAEIIFGYSAKEAQGKHISIIIPFDYQDEEYTLLDRVKVEDKVEVAETVRRTKDGRFIQVHLSAIAIRNADGKITGIMKKAQVLKELPDLPLREAGSDAIDKRTSADR